MASNPKEQGDDAPADGAEAAKPKRSIMKLAIIGIAALAIAGGGGFGAYKFFFAAKTQEVAAAPPPKPPAFLDLPDVLVNLAPAQNERSQYLKVKLVLELSDAAAVAQVQPVLPRVMDTFHVFLRELRPSDLEGSAGTYRLREEMTRRVNAAIAPNRVNAVLFKEMLVQ